VLGLRGAAIGGVAALVFLILANLVVGGQGATPEEAQFRSLFGTFSLGIPGSLAAFATIVATGLLIAVTARITVYATLRKID
jgi:cell division transport system permease protein